MQRRIPWPDDIQCPVVLCFHMDAESLLIAVDKNNAERPITLGHGTYGPRLGVPRIIHLVRKYNIPTSFFIPGVTAERHPYAVEAICREGYEVGVHGYTHDRSDSMSLEEEEEHLSKAKEVLTRMTGQNIRGYISPLSSLRAPYPVSPAAL